MKGRTITSEYHFSVTQIKRSAGQSAIAAAAYRAGEKLHSDYYGQDSDYTRKSGVVDKGVLLPSHVPRQYSDRQFLWNEVEKAEKHPVTEKMVNTIDTIIDLFHNTPTVILYGDSDAASEVVQLWRDDFAAGNSAFHFETISRMTAWREMDNDYGVIPFPKYDEAQETYLSLVHDTAYMYGVPSDCRNIDAVCALMEALAADSHRNVMPVYYDQVLKGKYARDTVSGQILDIIHDHPVADFAYINGYGFNTNIRYICNSTGSNTYVSEINSVLKMKKKELDKLIKMVENNG